MVNHQLTSGSRVSNFYRLKPTRIPSDVLRQPRPIGRQAILRSPAPAMDGNRSATPDGAHAQGKYRGGCGIDSLSRVPPLSSLALQFRRRTWLLPIFIRSEPRIGRSFNVVELSNCHLDVVYCSSCPGGRCSRRVRKSSNRRSPFIHKIRATILATATTIENYFQRTKRSYLFVASSMFPFSVI